MALLDTHDLGSNQEGVNGATILGAPVDQGDYYEFDGTDDGLRYATAPQNDELIDIYAKFRIHNKDKGIAQVIWKSGGTSNGIAIGLNAAGNLGVFGRVEGNLSSNTIPNAQIENNVWYELYATKCEIRLKNLTTGQIIKNTRAMYAMNGTSPESMAFAYSESPITGAGGNTCWFDGDIDKIEIWDEYTLEWPLPTYAYECTGTVNQKGNPVVRTVRSYKRTTGEFVAETTSNADGTFQVDAPDDTTDLQIIALDDDAGDPYNDLIFARVKGIAKT